MNLPAYIITCSPPSMNLPAHGTPSPDPSITSLHKSNPHLHRPPGGSSLSPGTRPLPDPLFHGHRMVEHILSLGATRRSAHP